MAWDICYGKIMVTGEKHVIRGGRYSMRVIGRPGAMWSRVVD